MYLNRAIWPFVLSVRGWVVGTAFASLAASGLSVSVAFSLAAAVTALLSSFTSDTGLEDAGQILLVTGALALARAVCLWLRDQAAITTATRLKRSVRTRLMDKLYELGPGYLWPRGRGGIQATIVDGVENLQGYVGFYLPQLIISWLVPAAVVAILLFVDWQVAMVVALCVLTVPFARRMWRFVLRNRATDHWDRYEAFAGKLGDTVRGMTTLVALGATGRRRRQLADAAEELRVATTANMRASLGVSMVMFAAVAVGTAGATLLAAVHASQGVLDTGQVILVLFLAAEAFRPQTELTAYWHEGYFGAASAEAVARLLATEPPVEETAGVTPVWLETPPSIEMDDVWFQYPGTDRDVLAGITFSVPGGSTLAIVGPSGSGKSTLGRLLMRDVDPIRGSVSLGGHALNEFPLDQLRQLTARVAQDVVLLSGSLRENVEAAGAEDVDIERAIDAARLGEVAADLPDGLDSEVGEAGRLLSGGQRQRVALARALVADAGVLLLDEATSALDAENEALITSVLEEQRGVRTTVVIAHRLSTVAHADYVLVLDEGKVVEFGPTSELASGDGAWAGLLADQRRALETLVANQRQAR